MGFYNDKISITDAISTIDTISIIDMSKNLSFSIGITYYGNARGWEGKTPSIRYIETFDTISNPGGEGYFGAASSRRGGTVRTVWRMVYEGASKNCGNRSELICFPGREGRDGHVSCPSVPAQKHGPIFALLVARRVVCLSLYSGICSNADSVGSGSINVGSS